MNTKYRKHITKLKTRINSYYKEHNRTLDVAPVYYVYVLLDSRKPGTWKYKVPGKTLTFTHQPFYVGKGKGSRMSSHLEAKANHRGNNHKQNIIAKIRKNGYEPIVQQISPLETEVTAFAKEHTLIRGIGRADQKNGPLVNLSNGGQGPSGYVHSEKVRKATSLAHTGKIVSAETREKLRLASTGKYHSAETKAKISAAKTGIKLSADHKAKIAAGNKGKIISAETIIKIKIARLGFKHSDASKKKMQKPKSEAAKENMRLAAKTRPPISAETRAKLSAISKARVRRKWTDAERAAMSRLKLGL